MGLLSTFIHLTVQKLTVSFHCKNSAEEPLECVEEGLSYLW